MKTETEFEKFFNEKILPELKNYQGEKDNFFKREKKVRFIAIFVFILFVFLSVTEINNIFAAFVIVPIIYIAPLLGKVLRINHEISKKYKKNVFLPIFNFFYDEVWYYPLQKFTLKTIQRSQLIFPSPGFRDGEDYIKVKIGKTVIQFCEITAHFNDPRGRKLFEGVFCVSQFNKNFNSNTVLLSKKNLGLLRMGQLGFKKIFNKGKIIKLEDPIFDREFLIFGEDEVEARYILSPKLMQRILDYRNKLKVNVSISFINNMVYFKIPLKRDLFDFSIISNFTNYNYIKRDIEYFLLFTDIVKDLELNTRIWSKN